MSSFYAKSQASKPRLSLTWGLVLIFMTAVYNINAVIASESDNHKVDLVKCKTASGAMAIDACKNALAIPGLSDRELASVNASLGSEYANEGHLTEAADYFSKSIALDKTIGVSYYNLGAVQSRLFAFSDAIGNFNQAQLLGYQGDSLFIGRCFVENLLSKYDSAIRDCHQAVALNPDASKVALVGSGDASYNKAVSLRDIDPAAERQLLVESLDDYTKSFQSKPNVGALLGRSRVLIEQGKLSKSFDKISLADADLKLALKVGNRSSLSVLNNRCWTLALLGHFSEAKESCDSAIELNPQDPATLDSRAFVAMRTCDPLAAIEYYNRAIGMDKERPTSLYGLGISLLMVADTDAKKLSARKYIELAVTKDAHIASDFKFYDSGNGAQDCRKKLSAGTVSAH